MDEKHPILHSFGHAVLVFIYSSTVAWVMFNAEKIFGEVESFWAPAAMLMLFVLSAAIVGALVLARPTILYLAGQKKQALQFFSYTVGWIFLFTLIVFVMLMAQK